MLPMYLDRVDEGRFVLTIHPPIPAPRSDDGVCDAMSALWSLIEQILLDGRLGDWEMWTDFELMRTGAAA